MDNRRHLPLLVGLPVAWLLVAAPVSALEEDGSPHEARGDELGDDHDPVNAQHGDDHYHLFYAEPGGDRNITKGFAAYQRTRDDEEKQERLAGERQDSRERTNAASRYYWWWPFRR
jgi:hypothetical protein